MFGYHDNDRCGFDLWSPVDSTGATENRAFSPYAKHSQETEDIINQCLDNARNGITNFSLDLDDDFSDEDLEYIQSEIQRRF